MFLTLSERPHTATAGQRADTVVLFETEVSIPGFLKFQVIAIPFKLDQSQMLSLCSWPYTGMTQVCDHESARHFKNPGHIPDEAFLLMQKV